jgi:CRISPR/Cas system CSM-associated protein Csm3 (group 7 of RAMP superfamily)
MRWIVRGDFVVVSPLSVHTGGPEEAWPTEHPTTEINDPVPYDEKQSATAPPILGIELDVNGFPLLPSSAVKGLLRGLASVASQSSGGDLSDRIRFLFGELPTEIGEGDQKSPTGGLIEFRTARMFDTKSVKTRPALRGKTELFEGTRTADDGQLRHDRVVAPGTRFRAEFVLTRATQEDVALLLGMLALMDGSSSQSALGSSVSQGDGRIRWDQPEVFVFGKDEARAWLNKPVGETWENAAKEIEVEAITLTADDGVVVDIPLTIEIDGHFLVSAWGTYEAEGEDEEIEIKPIRRPFQVSPDETTTARLPGASLDGALRAQARRIFRTMAGDGLPWEANDVQLPDAFESLFGSAKQASFLEVETFVAENKRVVRQEFVAIDRFSGGVAGDKKFAVEAFEQPKLTGRLRLRLSRRVNAALTGKQGLTESRVLDPAAVGLLALLLKDLATGDIPLGHATRKGYGGVRNLMSQSAGWKDILRALGEGIVANADHVAGFEVFKGKSGEDALRHAVDLLQGQAKAWADIRTPALAGGIE